jgi:hypothetical protein
VKCSGSPTNCIVVAPDSGAAAKDAIEAIVFREILKPLAAGLGPVGEVAIGSVADSIFTRPKS